MQRKVISLVLAALMLASLFAGCGASRQGAPAQTTAAAETKAETTAAATTTTAAAAEEKPAETTKAEEKPAETTKAEAKAAETTTTAAEQTTTAVTAVPDNAGAGAGSLKYPLDVKQTGKITYWKGISGDLIRKEGVSSDNGTGWADYLQEYTGLEIDFVNPAVGQEGEQFNLMIASGDLTDIVEYGWLNGYPAGPDDAIKKGLIYDWTDKIEEWAPDFLDFIRKTGELDKKFKSDGGRYWAVGFIRESGYLCTWRGPVVRIDLLEEYGLERPETIDEWTHMLQTFKDNGVEYPMSIGGLGGLLDEGAFCAWGAMPGIYQVDGKAVYGPAEPGFKDTLMLLREWYASGLLDQNFLVNDGAALNSLVGSGKVGATIGNTGGGIGAWTPVLKQNVPTGRLAAAKYPVVNKGDTPKFGQREQDFYQNYGNAVISAKSKNIEACMKLLNYGYTAEGDIFMNYGVEGKSFDWVDGIPTMKPEILLAPDNKAEWSYWARSPYSGMMIQREWYLTQLLVLPEQKEALTVWQTDRDRYNIPPVTQSVEEASEYSRINTDIRSFYDEFCGKFIIGEYPADAFESVFLATLEGMGLARMLELRQAALDRYNSR